MMGTDPLPQRSVLAVTTVITTAAVAVALVLAIGDRPALAALHRQRAAGRRGGPADRRRARAGGQQQAALRRYEVAFASISGRGELGEQVLAETAKALGLREGLHFTLQTDLAGGGAAKPDMVLRVGGGRTVPVDAKASMACWAEAVETDNAGRTARRAAGARAQPAVAGGGTVRQGLRSAGRTPSTARSCSSRRTRRWWRRWTPTRSCCAGCWTGGCSSAGRPGSPCWRRRRCSR